MDSRSAYACIARAPEVYWAARVGLSSQASKMLRHAHSSARTLRRHGDLPMQAAALALRMNQRQAADAGVYMATSVNRQNLDEEPISGVCRCEHLKGTIFRTDRYAGTRAHQQVSFAHPRIPYDTAWPPVTGLGACSTRPRSRSAVARRGAFLVTVAWSRHQGACGLKHMKSLPSKYLSAFTTTRYSTTPNMPI